MGREQGQESGDEQRRQKRGKIEWVIGGTSGVLVAAMIAFVLYQAFSATASKPLIYVTVQAVETTPVGHRVEFRAENRGGSTAADVTIEGTLASGGQMVEAINVTMDYVPANSERSGGMIFEHDPAQHQLQLRATGYNDP